MCIINVADPKTGLLQIRTVIMMYPIDVCRLIGKGECTRCDIKALLMTGSRCVYSIAKPFAGLDRMEYFTLDGRMIGMRQITPAGVGRLTAAAGVPVARERGNAGAYRN